MHRKRPREVDLPEGVFVDTLGIKELVNFTEGAAQEEAKRRRLQESQDRAFALFEQRAAQSHAATVLRESYNRENELFRTDPLLWGRHRRRDRRLLRESDEQDRHNLHNRAINELDSRRGVLNAQYTKKPIDILKPHHMSRNQAINVDHLRLTGSSSQARYTMQRETPTISTTNLWATDQPNPRNEGRMSLLDNSFYDHEKGLYQCINCRKWFTPKQVGSWFNPGYREIDLTVTHPLRSHELWDWSPSRSVYPSPLLVPLPANTPEDSDITRQNRAYDLFGDANLVDPYTIVVPRTEKPVVFTCSPECAEEQANFNRIRQHEMRRIQEADRFITQIELPNLIDPHTNLPPLRGSAIYRERMAHREPTSVLLGTQAVTTYPEETRADLFFARPPDPAVDRYRLIPPGGGDQYTTIPGVPPPTRPTPRFARSGSPL